MKKIVALLCLLPGAFLWADLTLVHTDNNITELRGAFALSNYMVWAVGMDGKVLKSTNDGYSWSEVVISGASAYHLNAVYFATENIGCIVGEKKVAPDRFKGIIYRTTNGGTSWYALSTENYLSESYVPFKDIVFDIVPGSENANVGYIAAGEGWVYETTDYGDHWTREHVDASSKHCFHGIDISWNNDVYAAGDGGNSTGIIATKTGSNWQTEYPFSELELDFVDVTVWNGYPYVVGSKGYYLNKIGDLWYSHHYLPDQQILYCCATFHGFVGRWFCGGSDETIRDPQAIVTDAYHNLFSKAIKGISAGSEGYYSTILSSSIYFVGEKGRIFRYFDDSDPCPARMDVYGEYRRVRCEINDREDPTYAYIYRSSCPDGPYDFVAEFDFPPTNPGQPYIWYDNSVSFNVDYYYKINTSIPNNPVHPSGLSNPSNPPQPPDWFTAEDYPYDDGGMVWLNWHWVSPSYTLHRDGRFFAATSQAERNDSSAVTGKNHEYKIRKRKWYNFPYYEYIYSTPTAVYRTPINNLTPSASTNLTGELISRTQIKIRWDEPDNIDIAGYNIYRKYYTGDYAKVNTVFNPRPFWYDSPTGYGTVYYKVTTVDWSNNESDYSNVIFFLREQQPNQDNIQEDKSPITVTSLQTIIPNPIINNAVISFNLAKDGFVQLEIFDVAGRTVDRIVEDNFYVGSHSVMLNVTTNDHITNGVYFVKMTTDDYSAVKKVIVGR